MMSTPQQLLLQLIKDHLPSYRSLPEEIAETLQVSVDSAYRRIRGETKLTLDESILLCKQYGIAPGILLPGSGNLNFSYKAVTSETEFQNYISAFTDMLTIMNQQNGELIYAGADAPLFYHFHFKEHAAFKIYYWLHAILQSEEFQSKKFSTSVISPQTLAIAQQSYEAYRLINTTEIWSETSVTSTYKQIAYCWEAGLFESNEEAWLVTRQLLDLLSLIHEQAGYPASQSRKQLYNSETEIGNNCVLIKTPHLIRVYLRHQTINTLTTEDEFFCNETDAFLKQLIKRSVLVSGSATKQRHQLFTQLKTPIERLLKDIEQKK